uniref:helix-hairpin-helix domain-containing protein n=1 Tax=Stieleria sp. TaxID=2795976 RepID=UPI003567B5C7
MDNSTIANVFDELAELLEFKGENPFRIRAYTQGAKAIRDLDESVADIVADPDRKLSDLAGIGKTLAEKTETLLQTGSLPQLEKLREEVPEVLIQMARVPGLGAKKAAKLQKELDIDSLADLRAACESGSVAKIKGFGEKTAQAILDGLAIAEQAAERLRWAEG